MAKLVTNQNLFSATGLVVKTARTGLIGPAAKDEDLVDCNTALAIRDFAIALWQVEDYRKSGNYQEAKSLDRIIRRCLRDKEKPVLELDDADWDFVTKKLEEKGPQVFGGNVVVVREALDAIEKQAAEDPKILKAKKA